MLAIIALISSLIFTDENIWILSEQKAGGKMNAKARCPDSHNITQIFPLISHLLNKWKETLNRLND